MTTVEWRQAHGVTGLMRVFCDAQVLESADIHVAQRLTALAKESDESVALAVAIAVRALRNGSVCVDLRSVEQQVGVDGLPWPDVDTWLAAVRASPLAGTPSALRLDGDLLYLDRYWLEEQQVADDVRTMIAVKPEKVSPDIDRLFPAGFEEQHAAAKVTLAQGLTVLTGGPGTGKTTTVARLLALLASGTRLRIALAAPTGKAAARLQEAVQLEVGKLDAADRQALSGMHATTLHRLLGSRPDTSARFRHNRANRLPHDVIVVDETSMVSLTMMARLLEAVRPDARLILVGDPDQLASVEAGAVLADLVAGLSGGPFGAAAGTGVVLLDRTWRFGGDIADLAAAVRAGDADRALAVLDRGGGEVTLVDPDAAAGDPVGDAVRQEVVGAAAGVRAAADAGDADEALLRLDVYRVPCAHRTGPRGVQEWTRRIENWLAADDLLPPQREWYPGRPVLVTANDYSLRLFNGDIGVAVRAGEQLRVAFSRHGRIVDYAPGRLADVQTVHAMTVHRSQGSQFDRVTVVLPEADSPLCTRELLYTALTRAQTRVRLIGTGAE